MSLIDRVFDSRCAARLIVAGLTSALLAGCSSDFTRLSDPSGNPFQNSSRVDNMPTATTAPRYSDAAPVSAVQSAPLSAPVQSSPLSPPSQRSSYAVPARPSPQIAAAPAARSGGAGWSAEGGTPIVVAQGETVGMLAARYGVPSDALLRANGFSSAAQVQPGSRLVVPIYNANGGGQQVAAAPGAPVRSIRAATPLATPVQQAVATGSPSQSARMRLAKGPAPAAERAVPQVVEHARTATKPAAETVARLAPPTKPMKVETIAKAEKAETIAKADAALARSKPVQTASLEPRATTGESKPAQTRTDATPTASLPPAAPAAAAEAASPEFRWPARGRIIQGFKSGSSDGINIAVPEGTSVKAAEGGVVAYAGSELKGYGNLVLIRHPNGFVSAYAHNGEVSVKRGETVKRGQIIAKSGQSGNVSSPQLHFELRKGSTPVDPTQYLAGL